MKAAVQQRLAEDAAAAARRRAAAAVHNLEVNATNAAMLARKKEAAQKEAETDAAIAAYVREREVREQVSTPGAGASMSVVSLTTLVMTCNQKDQEDNCTGLKVIACSCTISLAEWLLHALP